MYTERGLLGGSTLCFTKNELWDLLWRQSPNKSKEYSAKCRELIDTIDKNPDNEYPFTNHQWQFIINFVQPFFRTHKVYGNEKITDLKVVKL
jgi:hypothetical protein